MTIPEIEVRSIIGQLLQRVEEAEGIVDGGPVFRHSSKEVDSWWHRQWKLASAGLPRPSAVVTESDKSSTAVCRDKMIAVKYEVLADLVGLLEDSLRVRQTAIPEDAEVMTIGKRIGFGLLMDAASKCWREELEQHGGVGGEFTVGHCRTTIIKALAKLKNGTGL